MRSGEFIPTPAPPHVVTDSLGCAASRLHVSQEIAGSGMTFYRKRSGEQGLGHVETSASDRGFLIGVSLSEGHRRRIIHGRQASTHGFEKQSVYVRPFAEDYRADMIGAFDFLLLEVSQRAFDRAVDERMGTRVRGLECVTALADPVLAHLAHAMVPALERPAEASPLFVDQMSTVIETHLIEQYGGATAAAQPRQRGLSRLHLARAVDMLSASLDGKLTIAEVAGACGLSRGYFIKAFRESTGRTPHQWVMAQRVSNACRLLAHSSTPLAEVAAACGFADQSHFTRAFSQACGTTPGNWRRQQSA